MGEPGAVMSAAPGKPQTLPFDPFILFTTQAEAW
jgi:hypothetical protein